MIQSNVYVACSSVSGKVWWLRAAGYFRPEFYITFRGTKPAIGVKCGHSKLAVDTETRMADILDGLGLPWLRLHNFICVNFFEQHAAVQEICDTQVAQFLLTGPLPEQFASLCEGTPSKQCVPPFICHGGVGL